MSISHISGLRGFFLSNLIPRENKIFSYLHHKPLGLKLEAQNLGPLLIFTILSSVGIKLSK